jgi:hypothetical protein
LLTIIWKDKKNQHMWATKKGKKHCFLLLHIQTKKIIMLKYFSTISYFFFISWGEATVHWLSRNSPDRNNIIDSI